MKVTEEAFSKILVVIAIIAGVYLIGRAHGASSKEASCRDEIALGTDVIACSVICGDIVDYARRDGGGCQCGKPAPEVP